MANPAVQYLCLKENRILATPLYIREFLIQAREYPVLDVRSPAEYKHAHIPGAISFPLFTNEERAVIGTLYKQTSRQAAVKAGLDLFGPKMKPFVEQAEAIAEQQKTKRFLVHCWRGGMRSGAIAWLLQLYGFEIVTLAGGYKSFRRWCIEQFIKPRTLKVLGGFTCSGKTEALDTLAQKGHAIINLEGLAHHKGSAFGNLGEPEQPSQEMFENKLAISLWYIDTQHNHPPKPIWIEDESQRIGSVNLPIEFFKQKQNSPVYFLEVNFEQRLQNCIAAYGSFEKEQLIHAIVRIRKRLGGLETKTAIAALLDDDISTCFSILLKYYDKWYLKSLQRKEHLDAMLHKISLEELILL